MTFIWPYLLLSLLLVPLLVLLYLRLQRRRERIAASYGTLGIVQRAGSKTPGWRRHAPYVLFLLGLILLLNQNLVILFNECALRINASGNFP